MDNSSSELLKSIDPTVIFREICIYHYKSQGAESRVIDQQIINELSAVLPYDMKSERFMDNVTLINILNSLNIYPVITVDNFYLLIRSVNCMWIDCYNNFLRRIGNDIEICNRTKFKNMFMQNYGTQYNHLLDKILDTQKIHSEKFVIFVHYT